MVMRALAAAEVKIDLKPSTDQPIINSTKDEGSQEGITTHENSTVQKNEVTTINEKPSTDLYLESSSTLAPDSTLSALESTSSSSAIELSSAEISITSVSPPDDENEPDINNILPLTETPKRRVVYINQQQNGKLNVHLELSDVSVIVIPNQKDPQLSLLSLLLKSAQKSNGQSEAKKKEVEASINHHHDYSKYNHRSEDLNIAPSIESRAPYKVDISSTLGQQPALQVAPNSNQPSSFSPQLQPQLARSPIMQLLKPSTYVLQGAPGQTFANNRIFKRSIDSRLLNDDINKFGENYIHYKNDELGESNYNLIANDESVDSEFVLLGATENCGPGRKRNSYQVCVSISDS